jgi:hypothetical protein
MAQKAQAALVIFSVRLRTPFYAAVSAAVKVSQTSTGLSTPFDRHRAMLAWLCAGSCAKRKKSTNIELINAFQRAVKVGERRNFLASRSLFPIG